MTHRHQRNDTASRDMSTHSTLTQEGRWFGSLPPEMCTATPATLEARLESIGRAENEAQGQLQLLRKRRRMSQVRNEMDTGMSLYKVDIALTIMLYEGMDWDAAIAFLCPWKPHARKKVLSEQRMNAKTALENRWLTLAPNVLERFHDAERTPLRRVQWQRAMKFVHAW